MTAYRPCLFLQKRQTKVKICIYLSDLIRMRLFSLSVRNQQKFLESTWFSSRMRRAANPKLR